MIMSFAEVGAETKMPKQTILIATKNKHKAKELASLFVSVAHTVPLEKWENENNILPEPTEDGHSFAENAVLKARFYAQKTGLCALADDSGLSVLALNGAPGILSARYGYPHFNDQNRCEFLLSNMKNKWDRRGFFTSVLALAKPSGQSLFWEGQVFGLISRKPQGDGGFGYDPVFYYPLGRRTFGQMSGEEKNAISHRAVATRLFVADLNRVNRFLLGAFAPSS
ncbi:MAG: RdgB/HAM1 family non-canonical purine NTP pyrophosphatase [Candidatus Adiutrix sp.]